MTSHLLVILESKKLKSLLPENITSLLSNTMWKLMSKAVMSVWLRKRSDTSPMVTFNCYQPRLIGGKIY